jgi:hypothetical protein
VTTKELIDARLSRHESAIEMAHSTGSHDGS